MRPKQSGIGTGSEYHAGRGYAAHNPHSGLAQIPLNGSTVRQAKGDPLFRSYAQFPQKRFEDGEKAGAGVYYGLCVAG